MGCIHSKDSQTKRGSSRNSSKRASLASRLSDYSVNPDRYPETTQTSKVTYGLDDECHKTLNQYVMLKKIGSGAYGKVKLGMDRNTKQIYAIKVCHKPTLRKKKTGLDRDNALEDVYREFRIMKRMKHPCIMQLVEVIDDPSDDYLYLVMEYAEEGPVMKKSLQNPPLPEEKARRYMRDIIMGLQYLHLHKVIHRDIKPENLLVVNGRVKIADFGVSHEYTSSDILKKTAGSPAFQAPELCCAGTVAHGRAVDVWAAGVTLYCFIFGKCPWMAENVLEIYEKIKNCKFEFPHKINPELHDLLTKMLAKDPKQRIKINQIKVHPWITSHGRDPLPFVEGDDVEESDEEDNIPCSAPKPAMFYFVLIVKIKLKFAVLARRARQRTAEQQLTHSSGFRSAHSSLSRNNFYNKAPHKFRSSIGINSNFDDDDDEPTYHDGTGHDRQPVSSYYFPATTSLPSVPAFTPVVMTPQQSSDSSDQLATKEKRLSVSPTPTTGLLSAAACAPASQPLLRTTSVPIISS